MISKKFLALALSVFCCATAFSGCNSKSSSSSSSSSPSSEQEAPQPLEKSYLNEYGSYVLKQLGADVLPISVFVSPTPKHSSGFKTIDSMINDKYYQLMQECNINVVMGHNITGNEDMENLALCEKYGMAYIAPASPTFVTSNTEGIYGYNDFSAQKKEATRAEYVEWLNKYKDQPAFAGVRYSDEEGLDGYDDIGEAGKIFKEIYPDHLFYNNLLGSLANQEMMQYGGRFFTKFTATDNDLKLGGYRYFLDKFTEYTKPEVFSYDSYPIRQTGMSQNALSNMSIMINQANNNGGTFWNYIQAGRSEPTQKLPNAAEQRWTVNASLCFGCKGLELFTFFTPNDFFDIEASKGLGYFETAIDSDGNVTEYFDVIKQSLAQVPLMDEYLMNARWKGIMQSESTYGSAIAAPGGDLLDGFKQLKGITNSNSHVLIGCFEYGVDKKMALFVFNNSTEEPTNVVLEFNETVEGTYVKDNQKTTFKTKSNTFTVSYLQPGSAALLVAD